MQYLEMLSHFLEDNDPRLDHEIVNGLGILVARPHDSLELQPGVDERLGALAEDVCEDAAVVDDVQVDPVSLSIDPDLQVLVHRLQFLDPNKDVLLDVGGELALRDDFKGIQVLLDRLVQALRVDHDVRVLGVLERNDLELKFLPLVAYGPENGLILGFSVCVLDNLLNVFLVVLDVVLSQVHDRELVLRLEVRRLDQVKDLHPVASLQGVSAQVLDELDDQVRFLDLRLDDLADVPALPLNELVLRQLLVDVLSDLVDGLDDHLSVQVEEWRVVTHLPSLLPVQEDLPEPDRVLVDVLERFEVLGAGELVLGHFLFRILVVLVEELEELFVENDL